MSEKAEGRKKGKKERASEKEREKEKKKDSGGIQVLLDLQAQLGLENSLLSETSRDHNL